MMQKEYLIQDVWIVNYSVPYKIKNKLFRPFIITDIINDIVYGIPLTSYNNNRYRPDLGDFLIKPSFLEKQSIIKPYQVTFLKEDFFVRKVGTVELEIVKDINQKIDSNAKQYLAIKNTNAIFREYIIKRQNQKINSLELEIQRLRQEKEIKESELDLEIE